MENSHPMILALTDGKAGHETQTQGLVQLLNIDHDHQIEWISIQMPSKWLYRWIRFLIRFTFDPHWINYFFSPAELQRFQCKDIRYIISAGGNTLIANAVLKRYLAQQLVKNIVASSLRGIPATYFDVVFTIHQQQDHPPYLYYPIAPNKMTANRLTQSQAREHLGIQQAQQVISILIGASTKHVGIGTTEHWSMIIQKIKKQLPQAQLLITTSRRSSLQFEESLKTQLQKVLSARDQLICVVHGQNCDVKDFIQAADWVMVSADSTSMVAEVLMAEKKLLVAQLGKINDVRIREQLNDLEHQHWLKKINIEDDFNDINQYLNSINPLAHSKHLQIKLNQHLN